MAYLGLVENVRVRRAGFASRQRYDRFLKRYKMLSQYTWPNFRGTNDKDAVMVLLRDLQITDVQFGHTKLFIRFVLGIFELLAFNYFGCLSFFFNLIFNNNNNSAL